MDEIAAAEIRKWAWNEVAGLKHRHHDADKAITMGDRMACADCLAAWVMSGNPNGTSK